MNYIEYIWCSGRYRNAIKRIFWDRTSFLKNCAELFQLVHIGILVIVRILYAVWRCNLFFTFIYLIWSFYLTWFVILLLLICHLSFYFCCGRWFDSVNNVIIRSSFALIILSEVGSIIVFVIFVTTVGNTLTYWHFTTRKYIIMLLRDVISAVPV
jgi:hypothetical protein